MTAVLALDAGTTGVRALAVDGTGQVTDLAYRPIAQRFPRPGWVEQDPEELWAASRSVLAEVSERLAARGERVEAVGVANQRETALAWDRRSGRARRDAIVWQDRRTAARCEQLEEEGHLAAVRERTGLVLDPYFSATKFAWLLGDGGVEADAHLCLGTVDAWLLWRLTGGETFATDATNASRTMLFDITGLRWTEGLCTLFGVPQGALPEVRPTCGGFGVIAGELAGSAPGLAGVPICGVAGDQQAALFGQRCFTAGLAKATYGTGTFVLVNAGTAPPPPADGLLTTVAWDLGGRSGAHGRVHYALEGSDLASGAALDWLRDGLGIVAAAGELGELAASAGDSGGVVAVPAFSGLGSPRWDPRARGTVAGITRSTGRAQLARAFVEAIAFSVKDIVDAVNGATGAPCPELRVDGGVSAMALLLQLQADLLQVPVARPRSTESTGIGAALLAGLGAGVWGDLDDVASLPDDTERTLPALDPLVAGLAHGAWLRAVERAGGWARD